MTWAGGGGIPLVPDGQHTFSSLYTVPLQPVVKGYGFILIQVNVQYATFTGSVGIIGLLVQFKDTDRQMNIHRHTQADSQSS